MKKIYQLLCILFFISAAFAQDTANKNLLTINFNQNKNTAGVFQLHNPKLGIPKNYTMTFFKQKDLSKMPTKEKLNYLAQYAQSWLNFLNNIQLTNNKNPQQLLALTKQLASNQSPFLQVSSLYRSNMPASIASLNKELNSFYHYNFAQLQSVFAQLYNYLKPLSDDQSQRAAFELASKRFNNQGRNDPLTQLYNIAHIAPQPLQYWLYQLAQNIWQSLLIGAQQYINQQWAQLVIPFNQEFAQTFPFNSIASQQANMNNFVNDFAPDGSFDNFVMRYLRPFVNTYQNPWTLKQLSGDGLQLSNNTLQTLQITQTIQRLFFPSGDTHIRVPFSLETLSAPKNIKEIIVSIGKERFSYNAPKQIAKFTWPNLDDINGTTRITFIDNKNKKTSFSSNGPWGFWQVLKQAEIKPSNQNQAWVLIFKVDGQDAQMALYTNTTLNPFDLKRLSEFRLPTQLR